MVEFVGIDLGTTNTVVSYIDQTGEVNVLKIDKDSMVPSIVFFEDDKVLIGKKALNKLKVYPKCGVKTFKRKIGSSEIFKIETFNKNKLKTNKYIVVDTNIFINEIDFYKKLSKEEIVVLPKIVYTELEYRKTISKTQMQAKKAFEVIELLLSENKLEIKDSLNEYFPDNTFACNEKRNDVNDDAIFAITRELDNQGKNVVLLSNDRELRGKVESYNMKALTSIEFLAFKDSEQQIQEFNAEQITTIFLTELKKKIDKGLKSDIKNVVIAHPAVFSQSQKEATMEAAKKAGFTSIKLIKEPVAAASVYGVDAKVGETIGVYDFGGGTFDFSIIRKDENGDIECLVEDGDEKLGGEDVTKGLIDLLIEKIEDEFNEFENENLSLDKKMENEKVLYEKSEALKRLLAKSPKEDIEVEGFWITDTKRENIRIEVSKEEFEEEVLNDITDKVKLVINRAFKEVSFNSEEIDKVVLAGGTSMIESLQNDMVGFFGKKIIASKDVATIVSNGAAIYGLGKFSITSYLNYSIGLRVRDNEFSSVLDYKTKLPCAKTKIYVQTDDYQEGISIIIFEKERYSKGVFIADEGITKIGSVTIRNLSKYKKGEIDIIVTFAVDLDNILNVDVIIKDLKSDEIIEQKKLQINRY